MHVCTLYIRFNQNLSHRYNGRDDNTQNACMHVSMVSGGGRGLQPCAVYWYKKRHSVRMPHQFTVCKRSERISIGLCPHFPPGLPQLTTISRSCLDRFSWIRCSAMSQPPNASSPSSQTASRDRRRSHCRRSCRIRPAI